MKSSKNIINSVYLFSRILAVILVMFLFIMDNNSANINHSNLRRVHFYGICQTEENGDHKPLNKETLKELGPCEKLILTGHFNESIDANEQIFMYFRRINASVYQNGELIYSYGQRNLPFPILKAGGNVWGSFYSNEIRKQDEIKIVLENPYKANAPDIYDLFLKRLYIGDKMQLFFKMFHENAITTVACFLIFLLGMSLLFVTCTMYAIKVDGLAAIYQCGLVMIVGSLWILLDFSWLSLLFPYPTAWDVLETMVFLAIPTFALLYARSFMVTKANRVLGIVEHILLTLGNVWLFLQGIGLMDGETMQGIYRFLLPVVLIVSFIAFLYELRTNHKPNSILFFVSAIMLIICSLGGYVAYAIFGTYVVEVYTVGLVLFVIVQYWLAIRYAKLSYEKAQKVSRMEKELMENKVAIMLSQIQPHFLYNSLSSIQELCLDEPQKAHDALAQFAHFLRANMDSISNKYPIPFERELRHVKNYLALEKIRFEERLNVCYELEAEEFFIPALTLQPIVENAVRYGISKKKSGGTVTIATKEDADNIYIIVSDDGRGFIQDDPMKRWDGRSHIGIENVKERLASQCDGKVDVWSRIQEGTVVTITLPKEI